MNLEEKILTALHPETGITARELAKRLGQEKTEINSILYTLLKQGRTRKNDFHEWFLFADATTNAGAVNGSDNFKSPEPPAAAKIFKPTLEQIPVIEASPDAQLFVEAGPGTGKSETLVARLAFLLGAGGLNASQVLVVSFSVAAVRELKKRIELARQNGSASISYIDTRTFDSFASRFLRLVIPQNELAGLDYDQRIQRATRELPAGKSALSMLGDFKHILFDEMQDLVGVRADFACELLKSNQPCGFTLFGDSAQGIFDFTIENGPSPTTSGDLLKAIRKDYPKLDDSHRFTTNFRVDGDPRLENIALRGRTLLLESPDKARDFLEKQFADLEAQGSTGNPAIQPDLLHGATCVVCRTNAQVLRLAGELHKKNIPFQMARDKNEFLPPAWLGRVFLGWPYPDATVRRQEFLVRVQSSLAVTEEQALQLWTDLVSSFAPPKTASFNISDLRAAITDAVVMPEHPLYARNTNVIQLSTIHRSKGREFANIIVVMQTGDEDHQKSVPARGEDRTSDAAEPRVLFVALTRAKKSLHRMEAQSKGIWMSVERLIKSFPHPMGFIALAGFQVGLSLDVDQDAFAVGEPDDVYENQQWLLEKARPGMAVELWLDNLDDGCPGYKIMIDKCAVGRMSSKFGWALWHTLKNLNGHKPKKFPRRIIGIWVREIITAVGNQGKDGIDRSFQTSGLWLALTLEGLGQCEW